MQVYELNGRRWIAKTDHLRIGNLLIEYANEFGNPVADLVRTALDQGTPMGGGADEAVRYFGKSIAEIGYITAPLVTALSGMIDGFVEWLELTGFGDDRFLIKAFIVWAEVLGKAQQKSPTLGRATTKMLSTKPH